MATNATARTDDGSQPGSVTAEVSPVTPPESARPAEPHPGQRSRAHLAARICVTVAGLALAVGHTLWPQIKLDAFTGAFLAVAVVPWLAFLVKSFEIPGALKLELQTLAEQARGAAESARTSADVALATSARGGAERAGLRPDDLASLLEEYGRLRAQPTGPRRTAELTRVIGRMIGVAEARPDFDVRGALLSRDGGLRLAGYAYLHANPDPALLEPLVQSVTVLDDTAFGQYWGLRALGTIVSQSEHALPPELRAQLERYRRVSLRPGTDRDYELGKLLSSFGRERRAGG
jgi:hypothetical protein